MDPTGVRPTVPGDVGAYVARVGFAAREIAVAPGVELSGYPFVDRRAVGVHDPLLATAMVVGEGPSRVALVCVDLIAVGAELVRQCRDLVAAGTGIPPGRVMVAATHTHSGPPTRLGELFDDGVVGTPDPAFEGRVASVVASAVAAADDDARPARLAMGWCVAEPWVGGNRRRPGGAADPVVPVVAAFDDAGDPVGVLLGVACHPTVLQADNLLASGDLAWGVRDALARRLGRPLPVLYATGAAGDQSTRTTRRATTFEEVGRLGDLVASAVVGILPRLAGRPIDPEPPVLRAASCPVAPPLREIPPLAAALAAEVEAEGRLAALMRLGAPAAEVRTAEVTTFGAKHTVRYARRAERLPFPPTASGELQLLAVGEIVLVGFPVELFVELGLRLREDAAVPPMVVAYANDLLGYAPTRAAFREGGYEPAVTLLGEVAGEILVGTAQALIKGTFVGTGDAPGERASRHGSAT